MALWKLWETRGRDVQAERGACPPEDCGGPYRYQDLLKAISDPRHEEHDELLDWVGDDFDPEAFDARSVDSALGQMR